MSMALAFVRGCELGQLLLAANKDATRSAPVKGAQPRLRNHLVAVSRRGRVGSAHRAEERPERALRRGSAVVKRGASATDGVAEGGARGKTDYGVIFKYFGVCAFQLFCMCVTLYGLDRLYPIVQPRVDERVVNAAVYAVFTLMSLRSRLWSPLSAPRDKVSEVRNLKRPSWMPPPIAFPIVWSIIGFGLRPSAAFIAWNTAGCVFLQPALVAYALQVCVGDVWNHVTNVDRNVGFSLTVAVPVWLTAVAVAAAMYITNPTAGFVILPLAVWLSAAFAIIFATWNLNGRPPLLPQRALVA